MKSDLTIPIILASTSPRRIFLMSQVNLAVEVQTPQCDEKPLTKEKPRDLVFRLARNKAESVHMIAIQKHEQCIILAADTIVVAPGGRKILGKPNSPQEAHKMLKLLSSKKHTVLTGYCILFASRTKKKKRIVRVVQSRVKMRSLTDKEIARYVASGEPMDKAGAYGAQSLGMTLIESIEGSYTNVVGLPMTQIFIDLEKSFDIPLFSWMT